MKTTVGADGFLDPLTSLVRIQFDGDERAQYVPGGGMIYLPGQMQVVAETSVRMIQKKKKGGVIRWDESSGGSTKTYSMRFEASHGT